MVFGSLISILLCIWHVKRSWLKQLVYHMKDGEARMQLFARLQAIMEAGKRASTAALSEEQLRLEAMEEFKALCAELEPQYPKLAKYLIREWLGKVGKRVSSQHLLA